MFVAKTNTDLPHTYNGAFSGAFLSVFKKVFYGYVILAIIFSPDWEVYSAMAPYGFSAPGLFSYLHLPFPSLAAIQILKILTVACALLAFAGLWFQWATLVVFVGLLALDLFSNGFGFINVQIHVIWFAAAFTLCSRAPQTAFRWMELVFVLAYLQSGVAKLMTSGLDWALDGTTLQIAGLRQGHFWGQWLAAHQTLAILGSAVSIVFELSFALYYAFPKIRVPLLAVSLAFHFGTWMLLGIDFSHLWIFSATLLGFKSYHLSKDFSRKVKKYE